MFDQQQWLTQSDHLCLSPALSWLYPAHTGQVTVTPDAPWNSEASEANGTVSQHPVRPTRPWLTGACLSSRCPPYLSNLNPNCLLPNTRSANQNNQTLHLYSTGNWWSRPHRKVGRGEFCICIKRCQYSRARSGDQTIPPSCLWTHSQCGIPLVFVFPRRHVNTCNMTTHNVKSRFRPLRNACQHTQTYLFIFLKVSEH